MIRKIVGRLPWHKREAAILRLLLEPSRIAHALIGPARRATTQRKHAREYKCRLLAQQKRLAA